VQGEDPPPVSVAPCPAEKQQEIQAEADRARRQRHLRQHVGEALFNLELGAGLVQCARCHTKGWSYGDPQCHRWWRFRPEPHRGSTVRQFPESADMVDFIENGSEYGQRTASRAREAAACQASVACSPMSRSGPSSTTCGACEPCPFSSPRARHRLGARAAGHPHRHHRLRRPVRQRVPAARHQSGPVSASSWLAGLFGWMASWASVWWMYGIGLQGRLPSWEPAEPPIIIA
jgi:hypothetical protein